MKKSYLLLIILVANLAAPQVFAYDFVKHASRTFTDGFDRTGLIILGSGLAGTIFAFSQDIPMHDTWKDHQRMTEGAAGVGDFWGQGYMEIGIAAGQLVFDRQNGIVAAEGLVASTLVVYGLKYSVRRQRPDSTTATSFPSGHTYVAFATATSLTMSYGWWVGAPFYALATFTGMSRLADNAHWFSDVVAGSVIGILFARAPFDHHFGVAPLVYNDGSQGYGLQAHLEF